MAEPYDDYCYECSGYGDDFYFDDNGEMQSACDTCPFNDFDYKEGTNDG